MSSFDNNEINNNAFWYDKNEFYAENGLNKGKKKDSKSRSLKEREKAEKREKKVADIVSTLPNKMQKKLLDEMEHPISNQGTKPKKVIHSFRKNTSEDVAYNEDEEEVDDDQDADKSDYEMGLAMWIKYGLTKERYDADLEHRANIAALDAYYADPENYLAPEYGDLLEKKIQKFEEDAVAREKANEEEYCCFPEDYDDVEDEDEEDMAERYRQDRLESAIENARDDMHDDY